MCAFNLIIPGMVAHMHTPEHPALGFGDAEASVRSLWLNFKLWLHGVFEAGQEALRRGVTHDTGPVAGLVLLASAQCQSS